jgi:hypothetical protein
MDVTSLLELPEFSTDKEISSLLHCSPKHVGNLRRRGYLDYVRLGGKRVVIPRASVERFLQQHTISADKAVRDVA